MIIAKNKGFLIKEFFEDSIKLDFILEEDSNVNIHLLDSNLFHLKDLFSGELLKGYNEIEVNINEIKTNSYYYKIITNSNEITKVLYLVKYNDN